MTEPSGADVIGPPVPRPPTDGGTLDRYRCSIAFRHPRAHGRQTRDHRQDQHHDHLHPDTAAATAVVDERKVTASQPRRAARPSDTPGVHTDGRVRLRWPVQLRSPTQ